MIDHASVGVSNYERGKAFYTEALAPLGYAPTMDVPDYRACGFGEGQARDFWIAENEKGVSPAHLAFTAKTKEAVHAFHEAALAAGGKDNGAPGPRPNYGPNYYASFVFDPDGNNIEAVFRG